MMTLIDGPCKGTFLVKRAPKYLRAVIKPQLIGPGRETDVLDRPEDTPGPNEKVFVYQIQGKAGSLFLDASGKGGKELTGQYVMAQYKHLPDVDGEQLRDNDKWQAWCKERG